jgi:hypothetical protein
VDGEDCTTGENVLLGDREGLGTHTLGPLALSAWASEDDDDDRGRRNGKLQVAC